MPSEPQNRERGRLESLKKRLKADPRSLEFVSLAEEHNRLGEYAAAVDVAQRGLLTHPDSVAGRLALAVAEAEQNHVREALEQIKRALIIDQENPRALALMGRILLKRGLAKRAVQFLSHAVKLEPAQEEYRALLSMAKEEVRGADPGQVPVFSVSSIPPGENPWGDEETGDVSSDAEHTVFDPDELRRLERRRAEHPPHGQTKDVLPAEFGSEGPEDDEEPTAFMRKKPLAPPSRAAGAPEPPPAPVAKKAKVGGSAAEYSKMVPKDEADAVRAAAEARVAREGRDNPPAVPNAEDRSRLKAHASGAPGTGAVSSRKSAVKSVPAPGQTRPPKLPPVDPSDRGEPGERNGRAPGAPVAGGRAAGPAPTGRPPKASVSSGPGLAPAGRPPKASVSSGPGPEASPPGGEESRRRGPAAEGSDGKATGKRRKGPLAMVGPVATRFVDEAVWGLFGKKRDAASDGAASEPGLEGSVRTPARVRSGGVDDRDVGQKPRVVRTSERFGAWTRRAVAFVLVVAAAFIGHWVALSHTGPGPETASEELKGLAVDLERGGLAALLATEEQAKQLLKSHPTMEPLLDAALAEIYARRWRSFGREPRMQAEARARLTRVRGQRPTLEAIAAMVELSTSTASRKTLGKELARTLKAYPESPKAWAVRARLDAIDNRPVAAVESLYRALEVHPQHRRTLLELARWFGHREAYGTAFSFFDRLQERYPTDVEAAIDRYVLGQVSGKDPRQSEAVSALAGLVRDEIPEVAKDETGRAALAFAVANLASGEVQLGLRELEKAEAAYEDSPVFKRALADVFLAVGRFEQAKAHYEKALEHRGDDVEVRLGLARAGYGLRGRLSIDGEAAQAAIRKARARAPARRRGQADLPFGRVRLVPGRFALIEMDPRADIFPEAEYTALAARYSGVELSEALEARSRILLGDRLRRAGECARAVRLYEEARALGEEAAGRYGMGRCRLAFGDVEAARRELEGLLRAYPDHIAGRLALVEVHVARENTLAALEALEPLERNKVLSPEALALSARLRAKRGDFERSLQSAARLVDIESSNAEAWLLRGEAEYRLNRPEDALQSAIRALEIDRRLARRGLESSVQLYLVALASLRLGTSAGARRAVAQLRTVTARDDGPEEARFYLGRELLGRRRTRREGRRQLERFLRSAPEGPLRDQAVRLVRRR